MNNAFDQYEVWFVTGAQLLYGGDAVIAVDAHSNEMVNGLNESIISVRPVLTVEMFFYQERVHGQIGIDGVSNACHFGHLLHDHCIVYSVSRIFSPCKRTVIFYQYSRRMHRI